MNQKGRKEEEGEKVFEILKKRRAEMDYPKEERLQERFLSLSLHFHISSIQDIETMEYGMKA